MLARIPETSHYANWLASTRKVAEGSQNRMGQLIPVTADAFAITGSAQSRPVPRNILCDFNVVVVTSSAQSIPVLIKMATRDSLASKSLCGVGQKGR